MTAQPYTQEELDFIRGQVSSAEVVSVYGGDIVKVDARWLATVAERDERIASLLAQSVDWEGRALAASERIKELESAHARTLDVLAALVGEHPSNLREGRGLHAGKDWIIAVDAAEAHLKENGR